MPKAKESGGGTFTPAPAGAHVARCFACVALGTQQPNNPAFNPAFKVMLMFEIPNELVEGTDEPMTIGKEYTCSLSDKANLRKDLVGWRGRDFTAEELQGFDVANVVGQPCILSIVDYQKQNGGHGTKINSMSKLPKGSACPPPAHKPIIYEIEHGRNEVFNALPDWIKKKIEACDEWQVKKAPQVQPAPKAVPQQSPPVSSDEPESDDVPF